MNQGNTEGQLYIVGTRGYSAYEVAVQNGFVGTEQEWLDSLKGEQGIQGIQGKSAYEVAVENGYEGTEEEWVNSFLNPEGYVSKSDIVDNLTSDVNNKPLSAKQGKVLKNTIDNNYNEIEDALSEKANTSDIQNTYTTKTTFNQTVSSINSRIDSLGNGSPLVASSVSGMTDTSRVYVNTTDGKWYSYNGTTWVAGGVYQATQLDNEAVTFENLKSDINEVIFENKRNIDMIDYMNLALISSNTGVYSSSENRIATETYFNIKQTDLLTFDFLQPDVKNNIAFYDEDKNFISGLSFGRNTDINVKDYSYFRCSYAYTDDRNITSSNMAYLIDSINCSYEIHDKYILDEIETTSFKKDVLDDYSLILDPDNLKTYAMKFIPNTTAAMQAVRFKSRNILKPNMNFYNNNDAVFDGYDSDPTTRVRTESFSIPYGKKSLILSGLDNDIILKGCRSYTYEKTRLDEGSFYRKQEGVYFISLPENVTFINLVFAKKDDSIFDYSEVSALDLMLELNENDVIHDYVTPIADSINIPLSNMNRMITTISSYIKNNDYTILYATSNTITFENYIETTAFDEVEELEKKVVYNNELNNIIEYKRSKFFKDVNISDLFNYNWYDCEDSCDTFGLNSTSDEIFSAINSLVASSNGYITRTNLGKDASGEFDIYKYTLTQQTSVNVKKPKIILIGSQHGYEKGGGISCYYLIKELLNNWDKNKILEFLRFECELIIVPIANPWGFNQYNSSTQGTQTGYTNVNNININRNYSYGFVPNAGGSGEEAFSEVETQYIKQIIDDNTDAFVLMDIHTNGGTRTTNNRENLNWLSLTKEISNLLDKAAKEHLLNISRHMSKKYDNRYYNYGQITSSDISGMCKDYGLYNDISSLTFELAGRLPNTSSTEFMPDVNNFNITLLVNWLGCLLASHQIISKL